MHPTTSQQTNVHEARRSCWDTQEGADEPSLCHQVCEDRWCGQAAFSTLRMRLHLPSSLQGSATLQRGGRVAVPWGIPGHHSTATSGNLKQERGESRVSMLKPLWKAALATSHRQPQLKTLQTAFHRGWLTKSLFVKMQLKWEAWGI